MPHHKTQTWSLVAVLLVLAGARASAVELEPGAEIQATPGEPIEVVLELEAGEFVHAVFGQQGVDLTVTVGDPDGRSVWTRDNVQAASGVEDLWLVSERAGAHRVVFAVRGEGPGHIEVVEFERRPAGPGDRLRVRAESAMATARQNHLAGTPESLEIAREAAGTAYEAFTELGLVQRRNSAAYQLALCLRDQGRLEEAADLARRAIAAADPDDHPVGVSNLYSVLAGIHWRRGDFVAAAAAAEKAHEMLVGLDDPYQEAYALSSLAIYQSRLGRNDLAVVSTATAITLFEEAGHPISAMRTRMNLGLIEAELGNTDAALEAFREVIRQARARGVESTEGAAWHNMGHVYGTLGDHERAEECLATALEIRREIGEARAVASTLVNLGIAAGELGDGERAHDLFQQGLELYRSVENRDGEAFALFQIGDLIAEDDPEAGLVLLGQSLQLRREIGDRTGEGMTLTAMGEAHLAAGAAVAAKRRLLRAVEVAEQVADPFLETRSRFHLARAERALERLEPALDQVDRALAIAASVEQRIGSDELRVSWIASIRDLAEFKVDLLLELGRAEEAFRASEEARVRILVDLLAASGVRTTSDPERSEQLRDAAAAITRGRRALAEARRDGGGPSDRVAGLEADLRAAYDEHRVLRAEILADDPRRASFIRPQPATVDEARALLGPDAVLLEYLVGERGSVLFAVTSDGFWVHRLPPRSALESEVSALRQSLETPGRLGAARAAIAARRLHHELVAPVLDRIGDRKRLIVVPDGPLHAVPFDVLTEGSGGVNTDPGSTLLDRFVVSVLPSATAGALLSRRGSDGGIAISGRVTALADPELGDHAATELRTGGFPAGSLAASREEVRGIAAVVGADRATVFVGAEASEERVTSSEAVRAASTLHLATHGLVDELRPDRTAILLTATPGYDGFLHTFEVFDLDLAADLVVLSACQTGLGREYRGEGMLGLSHAFFHAGASRLVVSLWPVADASTRDLMVRFYEHLQDHEPATALTLAKRELAAKPKTADPFHWAAFVLIG